MNIPGNNDSYAGHAIYEFFDPETQAYSKLGLEKCETSIPKIKSRFRELAKTMHPDKGGDTDTWKEIIEARDYLVSNHNTESCVEEVKVGLTEKPVEPSSVSTPTTQVFWKPNAMAIIAAVFVFTSATLGTMMISKNSRTNMSGVLYGGILAAFTYFIFSYLNSSSKSKNSDLPIAPPPASEIAAPVPEIEAEKPSADVVEGDFVVSGESDVSVNVTTDATTTTTETGVVESTNDTNEVNGTDDAKEPEKEAVNNNYLSRVVSAVSAIAIIVALGGWFFGGSATLPSIRRPSIPRFNNNSIVYLVMAGAIIGVTIWFLYKYGPKPAVPDVLKKKPDFLTKLIATIKAYYQTPLLFLTILAGILITVKSIPYFSGMTWNPLYEVVILAAICVMAYINWEKIKESPLIPDFASKLIDKHPIGAVYAAVFMYIMIRFFMPRISSLSGLSGVSGVPNVPSITNERLAYVYLIMAIVSGMFLPLPALIFSVIASGLYLIMTLLSSLKGLSNVLPRNVGSSLKLRVGSMFFVIVAILVLAWMFKEPIKKWILAQFAQKDDSKEPEPQRALWEQYSLPIIAGVVILLVTFGVLMIYNQYASYTTKNVSVTVKRIVEMAPAPPINVKRPVQQKSMFSWYTILLVLCSVLALSGYFFKDQGASIASNLFTSKGNEKDAPIPTQNLDESVSEVPVRVTEEEPNYYSAGGSEEKPMGIPVEPTTTTDENTHASYIPTRPGMAGTHVHHQHLMNALGHQHLLVPFGHGPNTCIGVQPIAGPFIFTDVVI